MHRYIHSLPGDGTQDTVRNAIIAHGYDGLWFNHMTCAETSQCLNTLTHELPKYIANPAKMLVYNTTAPAMIAVKLDDTAASLRSSTHLWRDEENGFFVVPAVHEERLLLIKRQLSNSTIVFDTHYRLSGRNPSWLTVLKAEICVHERSFASAMIAYLRTDEEQATPKERQLHAAEMVQHATAAAGLLEKISQGFASESWAAYDVLIEIQRRIN